MKVLVRYSDLNLNIGSKLGAFYRHPAVSAVLPPVELIMYETPASVSVASSHYEGLEVKRLQVVADTEATYYPGHEPPVTPFVMDSLVEAPKAALYPGPQVSPPVAMRQSVIRLNQKITLRKKREEIKQQNCLFFLLIRYARVEF